MGVDNRGLENFMSGLSLKQSTLAQLSQAALGSSPNFAPPIASVLALKSGLAALSKVSGQETKSATVKPNLAQPNELLYSIANAFTGQKADNPQVALGQIANKINDTQRALESTGFKATDASKIAQRPANEAIPALANYAETVANAFKNQNKMQAQARQKFGFNMPGTV
ncbi:MAG: hypothetical protein RLZZ361_868 [Cyanobacteriota bacterium]|jgi:hypothetical protein